MLQKDGSSLNLILQWIGPMHFNWKRILYTMLTIDIFLRQQKIGLPVYDCSLNMQLFTSTHVYMTYWEKLLILVNPYT